MKPAALPSPLSLCVHLLLIGLSGTLNIIAPTEPVQGLVGGCVLLPVTYSIAHPPATMQIIWSHENSIVLFSEMTMRVSEASPTLKISDEYHIAVGQYQDRVVFYPENASLLLRDVRRNDSGRYTVTFQELNQSRSMILVIHELETTPSHPDFTQYSHEEEDGRSVSSLIGRGICAIIFALLIVSFLCTWWRKAKKYQPEVL